MRFRLCLPLLPALLLAGCASLISAYNDKYACPYETTDHPCEQASKAALRAMTKQAIPPPPDPGRSDPPGTSPDTWVPPVRTVWIAPYTDTFGRRHEPAILRIVVLPGPPAITPEPEFLVPPVPQTADDGSQIGPPVPPAETPATTKPTSPGTTPQNRTPRTSALPRSPIGSVTTPPTPGFGSPGGFTIPGY
jgi:hypothetical protein